jgi:hypothetical protein
MKKFLVLYRSPVSTADMMSKMSPEQSKQGMDMWMKWAQRCGSALVDMGAPLGEVTSIRGSASGFLGGYSIIQGESKEAAKKLLDEHPHLQMPGASIDMVEMLKLPGM